jgi:hypothetical protein
VSPGVPRIIPSTPTSENVRDVSTIARVGEDVTSLVVSISD